MICKHVLLIKSLNKPGLIFFFCTHLNGFNYCCLTLTIQIDITHLFVQVLLIINSYSIQHYSFVCAVKWFQVLLCITNNSIKHQSFIYTHLNVLTVLFQTIQFSISLLSVENSNNSISPWIGPC